jgi:hypothetical protein
MTDVINCVTPTSLNTGAGLMPWFAMMPPGFAVWMHGCGSRSEVGRANRGFRAGLEAVRAEAAGPGSQVVESEALLTGNATDAVHLAQGMPSRPTGPGRHTPRPTSIRSSIRRFAHASGWTVDHLG